MRYTWDENKRQATLKARGLDFAKVEQLFERPTFTSQREKALLTVVEPGIFPEDHIHVISMRKADRDEQELYFRNAGFYGS